MEKKEREVVRRRIERKEGERMTHHTIYSQSILLMDVINY